MRNGWPAPDRLRRAARSLVVPALALAVVGCAQKEKRPGFFGGESAKPIAPGLASVRPEPGLRVRAPFVDVQVADAPAGSGVDAGAGAAAPKVATGPVEGETRVGLFRSPSSSSSTPSSSRSLETTPPLN